MKALSSAIVALTIAALPLVCSSQSGEKDLRNLSGTVTYGASQNPTKPLAKNATTVLSDNDFAATGANSKATISLPDSSVVMVGSNSNVQMKSFDNASGIGTARFVVLGKVRFQVEHPAGAKADYTFQTPTGQIAVRGTVGDIFAQPGGGLQVNVYAISNPALPVQVTLVNGQVFTLAAGQSLVVTAAAGAIVGSVTTLSQSMFAPFSELGAPANAASLGITTTTAAGAAAAGTAAATTAAAAAIGTAAVVTTTSNHGTPAAPPTPAPTSTSVPITISGHPATVPAAIPGPPSIPGQPGTIRIPHPLTRPTPPVN